MRTRTGMAQLGPESRVIFFLCQDKELAILQKVVEDGEVAESMQPSEQATVNIVQCAWHVNLERPVKDVGTRQGLRDYIDFALDEAAMR